MKPFKNILKTILQYGIVFIIFTFIYLIVFNTTFLSNQNILFYRGIELLVILTFLSIIFLLFFPLQGLRANMESLIAAVIVSASLNLCVFVVLPVTFERSITMYLLNSLRDSNENNCQGINKKELEKKFIKEYVNNKAIDKRLDEQKVIGFVQEKNQCIQLTPQALSFLKFSEIVGRLYGL